jgi:lipopolysaccharide transport system ATP-binding protein
VGSLLEVGTGFHPELSGRDNTYLSGAILGMSRREIERKFDEIVAFAEIEKFIDTPVKHYSSGMYVRLAFAVAAHLDPEILLVDEVLAVGDINFQKKCLGKMSEVAKGGRTVVLVSHQLNQIRRLCERVAWVDEGSIRQSGPTHEVVSAYESAMARGGRNGNRSGVTRGTKGHFVSWRICDTDQTEPYILTTLGPVKFEFTLQMSKEIKHAIHGIALFNSDRQLIWGTAAFNLNFDEGLHTLTYEFPALPLRPGPYSWLLSLYEEDEELDMWDATPELVVATESYQHPRDEWSGILNVPCVFSLGEDRQKYGRV